MVREGQKWPKCTSTITVLIINDKKTTFRGVKILTYFFTRNVPKIKVGLGLLAVANFTELLEDRKEQNSDKNDLATKAHKEMEFEI